MGFYIEVPENLEKALQLKRDHGAQYINEPETFSEVPKGKALICVVENGPFDAAAICTDEREFEAFAWPDGRRKTWLLMDRSKVLELCPHVEKFLK